MRARYPNAQIDILGMTTRGDQILDRTLSKVGGKGLFVKELETAMKSMDSGTSIARMRSPIKTTAPRRTAIRTRSLPA